MSHQEKYKKLVEDMQRYILNVHAAHDFKFVDKTTHAFFQKETKIVTKTTPHQVRQNPLPQKAPEIRPSLPMPPRQVHAPLKREEKIEVQEKKPVEEPQKNLSFRSSQKSEEISSETYLSEIEKVIKKIAPNFQILKEAKADEFVNESTQRKEEAAFITFEKTEELFALRITEAMAGQLKTSALIQPVSFFENLDVCKTFFNNHPFKFFIGQIEKIEAHPILKEFFRRSPNNSLFFLGGTPLLAFEKESTYESEPSKKRFLWGEIKVFLKGDKNF